MTRPLWLWIDPTRECGLKCKFCYTKRSHTVEHLSLNNLRAILDVLLSEPDLNLQKLNFNWRGDPLMNPGFLSLLQELEGRQLAFPVEFHTNGTSIDAPTADQLIETARRTRIFVSIDGGNEKSHDLNRGVGTFRAALDGLSRLLDARGPRSLPRIGLFQLDLGVPESAYDVTFTRLASCVDEWVRILPIHPVSGRRIRPQTRVADSALVRATPPVVSPDDRWWAMEVPHAGAQPQGPCFWAGNALFVAPNGDVSVCLLSHTIDGVLGNLLSTPLPEILERAGDFRTHITAIGRASIPHCARCRVAAGDPRPSTDDRHLIDG
jgi:sulfatase maturation enzyme AslB (radical SAM superfamily)